MRLALFLSVAFCVIPGATATAQAQSVETRRSYDIAGGPLSQVLNAYASAAGVELSMDAALLHGKRSNGLSGSYSVREGFGELLRGQGLQALPESNGSYTLRPAPAPCMATRPGSARPAPAPTRPSSKRRNRSRSWARRKSTP
jgi:iron complex outermembrane receptor protein